MNALLLRGADLRKAKSDNGETPVYAAARQGHVGTLALLLEHDADPNQARTDGGSTPLFIVAEETRGHAVGGL